MSLMPFIYGWVVLVIVVASLAFRRLMVGRHDDERLHLAESEAALLTQQSAVGQQIRTTDRWGQWLTVAAVLYGLVLLVVYLYGIWIEGAKLPT